jgi:hypothetical protein
VTGFPKFKAEKVRYDQEPVFQKRLLPAADVGDGEGNYPDLPGPVDIEWLGMRAECLPRPVPADPKKPPRDAEKPAGRAPRVRKAKPVADAPDDLPEAPEWAEPVPAGAPPVEVVVPVNVPPAPKRRKRTLVIDGSDK